MTRRFFTILAASTAIAMTGVSVPSYAATSYETDVTNHVSIGDINVRLSEYGLDDDGNETAYRNNRMVLPGERVDQIVRITNLANTAWIRMKLEYTSDDGIKDLSDDMVVLASDEWIRAGDCWYWPKPMEKDESEDFIRQVMIPPEWDETYAGKEFAIVVTAEAVQAVNFTPDFEALDPWFGTVIETCTHTVYKEPEAEAGKAFSVVFENGAEGLVRTGDDFFSNWSALMPGDVVSDTVQLKNSYHRPVTMYFRSETLSDNALAKALRLKITAGDKTVYDGTLDGAVAEQVELARLASGQEAELVYTLTVPAELDNRYAMASAKTKWIFSANVKNSGGGGGGGTSGGHSGNDSSHGPGMSQETGPSPAEPEGNSIIQDVIEHTKDWIEGHVPKLGDTGMEYTLAGITVISFVGVIALMKKKKREDCHDEEKSF